MVALILVGNYSYLQTQCNSAIPWGWIFVVRLRTARLSLTKGIVEITLASSTRIASLVLSFMYEIVNQDSEVSFGKAQFPVYPCGFSSAVTMSLALDWSPSKIVGHQQLLSYRNQFHGAPKTLLFVQCTLYFM